MYVGGTDIENKEIEIEGQRARETDVDKQRGVRRGQKYQDSRARLSGNNASPNAPDKIRKQCNTEPKAASLADTPMDLLHFIFLPCPLVRRHTNTREARLRPYSSSELRPSGEIDPRSHFRPLDFGQFRPSAPGRAQSLRDMSRGCQRGKRG